MAGRKKRYNFQLSGPARRMFGASLPIPCVWDEIREHILPAHGDMFRAEYAKLEKLMTNSVFARFESHAGSGKSHYLVRMAKLWECYWEAQSNKLKKPYPGILFVSTAYNQHRLALIEKLRAVDCNRVYVVEAGVDEVQCMQDEVVSLSLCPDDLSERNFHRVHREDWLPSDLLRCVLREHQLGAHRDRICQRLDTARSAKSKPCKNARQ